MDSDNTPQTAIARLARRTMLQQTACGFGSLAASALAAQELVTERTSAGPPAGGPSRKQGPTRTPRAKRIIFLFMQGGVSQVDSFDYKPQLQQYDGKTMPFDDARTLAKTGRRAVEQRLMNSPWQFKPYGESGRHVSELFPHTAKHVDDLCFLHGMHTDGVAHGPATLFLHCGSTNFVRPSLGSWVYYGLGTENNDLPGFVSISPSIGNGGPRNYGAAFLPARYQGTAIGTAGEESLAIDHLNRPGITDASQRSQMELIEQLNRRQIQRRGFSNGEFDAVLESYELAWRMQQVAPDVLDLSSESAHTLSEYGIDQPSTREFGKKCLLARRLCESGVRFVQVNYGDNSANPAWDQHSNLPKHATHARAVDQPIAALLADLKRRGLLDDTIVWWGGEFGRTPYSQSNGTGRDHNPGGFTVWLAGGGFRPGTAYGATDEFGFSAVQGKVHMHDLHATLLHQLGLDHKQLTFRHAGRDFRLTDVYGRVVDPILS
ncbi:DUF1501 domain-containing protein [Roseiconus nitratireducens]|uniref:DUF1501 domain-containing protein n=1 Tax=Roseiconus nitratireducens TaxID=2605748 RepID=A0A5M6DDB2_9BACT|nr:DUF1501 domain-containing protein [Roseiconus nitratireducens]KAA5545514.1 DUF1501 domain-containing protein [Roseiconus nitratireducens]